VAEAALNELPLVIFNMGRGQQDYFQCTRGGGWGDYRTITLAPSSVVEADELTRLAFELADKWLTPVIVYGDALIGFTQMTVEDDSARTATPAPPKPWALDGSSGGSGRSKVIWTWRLGKHNTPGPGPGRHWESVAAKYDEAARAEPRHDASHGDDAEHLVVSFGTTGPFVDYVVDELRGEGHAIGTFRPVTLWPFPADALAAAAARCTQVLVYELNAGQMIDDVRLAVNGAVPVHPIGGVSQDESGMRQGELLDVQIMRARILAALTGSGVVR
jgi:2-oxoglutarate ferredoxin oxidoreductase subunit alpha